MKIICINSCILETYLLPLHHRKQQRRDKLLNSMANFITVGDLIKDLSKYNETDKIEIKVESQHNRKCVYPLIHKDDFENVSISIHGGVVRLFATLSKNKDLINKNIK